MKHLKNIIATVTLVSLLGVGNSFAAGSNDNAPTAETWFGSVYTYVASFFKADTEKESAKPRNEKLAVNHNETLVRDEI